MLWDDMQIDVVMVREDKLFQTQRVLGPRFLPNSQRARAKLAEYIVADGAVGYHHAAAGDYFESMIRKIVGILPNFRHQFGELDRERDFPIRPENEVAHVVCEHR